MKKYLNFKRKLTVCILTAVTTMSGCNGFLDLTPPPTSPSTATIFSSDANAEAAVADLYAGELPGSFVEVGTMTLGLYADELFATFSSDGWTQFETGAVLPDNSYVSNQFWSDNYKEIYNTNIIMENLKISQGITEASKQQFRGESLFFRALSYFTLVNAFGAVPLVTSTDFEVNAKLPRTDTATVINQVIADLKESQSLLTENYLHGTHVRVNKWASTALLARVYQCQGQWQNAYDEAAKVIESGMYGPLPAPEQAFINPSPESILQIGPKTPNQSSIDEAGYFMPYSADETPTWAVRKELVEAFEPGDRRFSAWVGYQKIDALEYYYPAKYKFISLDYPREDVILLRLAEMYLIRAEAAVHLGKVNDAITNVDVIRSRAGLPLISATTPTIGPDELLAKIYQERRVELCFEHGFRWYDLKRTGRANAVLSVLKPTTWKATRLLLPIPEDQLLANPFLTPNPGYY